MAAEQVRRDEALVTGHGPMILTGAYPRTVAELWLARWLDESDRLHELRQRADNGDEYARRWLDEALSQQ